MSSPVLNAIVFSFFLLFICDQSSAQQSETLVGEKAPALTREAHVNLVPEIELKDLTKSFQSWWKYSYYSIRLEREFVGLDTDSTLLNKSEFLKKLATGKFISIKLKAPENELVYRLYPAEQLAESIRDNAARMAQKARLFFLMEGKDLPVLDVVDVKGRAYNQQSFLGKLTIMKTWFIKCQACIQEFPEVNKLVEQYQDNPKVQFLSLANDSQPELIKFLEKQELKYAVIPNMQSYIQKDLQLNAYPTHLVIDTDGKILKVFEHLDDMKLFIASAVMKFELHPTGKDREISED